MDERQEGAAADGVFDAAVFGQAVFQPLHGGQVDAGGVLDGAGDALVQVGVGGDGGEGERGDRFDDGAEQLVFGQAERLAVERGVEGVRPVLAGLVSPDAADEVR
ncbi:hypothetical protein [Nonomuraea fuscirosea]|uniref:hypothetical protein n=1 Tax=Nonomuraea fuscirosea TaxID=1291556 RepID=UPI0033C5A2B1